MNQIKTDFVRMEKQFGRLQNDLDHLKRINDVMKEREVKILKEKKDLNRQLKSTIDEV